jgi:hypothetical protein
MLDYLSDKHDHIVNVTESYFKIIDSEHKFTKEELFKLIENFPNSILISIGWHFANRNDFNNSFLIFMKL